MNGPAELSRFAARTGVRREDCTFYTVLELPGETVPGNWDLRSCVDDYLGRQNFRGRSVLEIGPASGYLTFEMERRGAEVTAIELGGGFLGHPVPNPDTDWEQMMEERSELMHRIHNGFWYAHEKLGSQARVYYGDAGNLPPDLGTFDIGLLGAVLLHSRDPMAILRSCAERCRTLVITEAWNPWMEGISLPVMRLIPSGKHPNPHTWWQFAPSFFEAATSIWGFKKTNYITSQAVLNDARVCPLYTLVFER